MNISGNTILITGGASGIGLAFAERFLQAGNEVIIVGRREAKLKEAKEKFPKLHTRVCDVANVEDRLSLFQWVKSEFPELNVLVNNAGIQQRVNLLRADKEWDYYRQEIAINLDGPIHLCMLFIPHLVKKQNAAIINVSSGLSLAPGVWVPVYSATKAALHSFTISLRHQLADTDVKVIEVLPPAVNTDLGGVGLHTFGAPVDQFADAIFQGLSNGDLEIGYGDAEKRLHASRDELNQSTKRAWENFLQNNPGFLE
ncbi:MULTISPECIES: SDR family oxidoreductase [Thermoactinomyces]|uniref:SDR family NAD(P)-dependent oxidoreductase n=1 Tax=Thermoactinomyces daqus TaxID=1329516 RepID=A0A7W1X7H7_9BACL|nr:SDR family NAD(P)-dependent oxidoreductase [Thermoactinomyces daqus]MBA4541444.1 SDR family NAD(P)-dependent oxidoreductase [Thermoactinomyces daqus]MBH8596916.1 SDR family NAD(P)-dependent oxidoreductase [Thermoactinomyces sp. CICC 10523]MBH8603692.1 SDR family NAD(P)-dependent oxidoreductase [Thermoactinomyces sp. CICC 10522]